MPEQLDPVKAWEELEAWLSGYEATPRLTLWDWRMILIALAKDGQKLRWNHLIEAISEDGASTAPVEAFAPLLYVPDD